MSKGKAEALASQSSGETKDTAECGQGPMGSWVGEGKPSCSSRFEVGAHLRLRPTSW